MSWKKQVLWGIKCCLKNQNYQRKLLEKFTQLRVNENQWVKNSERKTMKWSERKKNLHPLVAMDTDSFSTEVSNKGNNVPSSKN
jgi:hypothetical protein